MSRRVESQRDQFAYRIAAEHCPHQDLADSHRAHGTVHTTGGRILPGWKLAVADTATQQSRLADPAGWSHHVAVTPSGLAVAGARAYASLRGLGDPHDSDYSRVMQSPERVARVGRHYDAMPDHDPAALPHYHAMLKEVGDQYDFMTNRLGIKVQPVDYDPYAHVGEMMADVNNNKTLKVLGTHVTGGHPVFGNEGNDKFRAVHDFFGHAATGRDFDRHGEHATYLAHARMFSPHAVPALTNETLGQNSSLILNGHFGPQKIGVIPRHVTAARLAMPLPLPEGITFHYHETDDTIPDGIYDQEFESPAVEARHNDDHVGYLAWDYDRYPAPTMVNVHPDYRRHGIGTALWDFARQHEPDLQHSENLTDLGEKWVNHEQSRTAGLDSLDDLAAAGYNTDEWSRWQGGGCLEYAHALLEKFPHLSAGALYRDDGEFSDFQHHFAHDDTHAYDSAGRHPLPYHGVHGDMKMLLNDDLGDYDEPDPDEVAAAHQHIERNGIGPRTDPHTASRPRLAMPAPLPDDITFQLHRRQDTLDEAMRHSKFFADVPTVTAHLGDDPDPIGHLEWHGIDSGYPVGQVEFIHVKPDHRRHSIATAMFDWVKQNAEPRLHHSDEHTELGRQWVNHEQSRPGTTTPPSDTQSQ